MNLHLDIIDQKILIVLLKHGRISITELSKVIKHNYPTVRNRVNKLIENKVISYFYPVVQFPGIGARRYLGIYLNLKNLTKDKHKEIFKKLCKNPFLIEVCDLEGRWNVGLLLVCNYVKGANETLEFIQQLTKDHLTDLVVMPTFTISNLNRKFFSDINIEIKNIKTGFAPLIKKTPLVHLSKPMKLSKEDIQLLDYIKLNARDNLGDIGDHISMDPTSVDYKLRKMISSNLIKYFTIQLNSEILGYEKYLLFLNLKGSKEGKDKLIKYLRTLKEAYHFFEYMNYWELVITFCVKDRNKIQNILSDIQSKFRDYIKDHEILWLVKHYKKEPYPLIKNMGNGFIQ